MLVSRRALLGGTAAVLAGGAGAVGFPDKPLHLVVGYPPGAATDYAARIIGDAVAARLGQPVLVESRPGAGSMIGVDYVAKSAPDGTTLMFANADATSMLAAVKPNVPYDIGKDFSYIARLATFSYALSVNNAVPIHDMAEFVAYARANPGKLRYGTTGAWGSSNVVAYLLEQQTGIKLTAVPYRGLAQVMTDLLAGFIEVGIFTTTSTVNTMQSGKTRVLAVTSEARSPILKDVPTMAEAGYAGATQSDWFGILAPAKVPADVVARLQEVFVAALADPTVRQRYVPVGLDPAPLTGDAFQAFVMQQYQQGKAIAQANHIVLE